MTQYSGIPSISRYVKWLLYIPITKVVGLVYPAEVTFWIELGGTQPVAVFIRFGRSGTTCKDVSMVLHKHYLHFWFLVCFLFHCSVLHSLFDYNLATIVDIQSLLRGLAVEHATAHLVPAVERDVACFNVHFTNLGNFTIDIQKTQSDALW